LGNERFSWSWNRDNRGIDVFFDKKLIINISEKDLEIRIETLYNNISSINYVKNNLIVYLDIEKELIDNSKGG
jgi:hypothetical protein